MPTRAAAASLKCRKLRSAKRNDASCAYSAFVSIDALDLLFGTVRPVQVTRFPPRFRRPPHGAYPRNIISCYDIIVGVDVLSRSRTGARRSAVAADMNAGGNDMN